MLDATPMSSQVQAILENPKLWERITRNEFDKKIVKEYETRETVFLCACGRLVENAQESSYNLMINSESGAGKDYVTSKVLEILPTDCLEKRKTISPKVFTYWHNAKFEPEWSWDGKVVYLEDVPNQILNADPMKLMASSGNGASTIVINNRAVDILVNGKPIIMITTASSTPNPENLRRFTILNLDESADQTKEILKRQAEFAKKGIVPNYDPIITKALSFLNQVKVRVPFADKIYHYFPDNIIIRTAFNRFIDYIKASAALYQYQRKKDDEGFVIATEDDYKRARVALMKTTSNKYLIPLTKDQKHIIKIFEKIDRKQYTMSELVPKMPFLSESTLRRRLRELSEYGIIQSAAEKDDKVYKQVFSYSGLVDIKIPISLNSENRENLEKREKSEKRDCACQDFTLFNKNRLSLFPSRREISEKKAKDILENYFEKAVKDGFIFETSPGMWKKV